MSDGSSQVQLGGDLREGQHRANTPLEWIAPVAKAVGGFDLDPCASASSDLASENIRESGGLAADWSSYGTVWLNHPFSEPADWLEKAAETDADTVVSLSKADPSTEWFQKQALRAELLAFPATRINFIGYDNSAGFPVVYGVFGDCPAELLDWFDSVGWVVREPGHNAGERQ
ncbi:DNA N-6-adenine-methyltransferase [Halobacteriales archaeon Cl-PHB]